MIRTVRSVFCDRCGNWFGDTVGDRAVTVRRKAHRRGWRRREGRDLCPDHATPPAAVADTAHERTEPDA